MTHKMTYRWNDFFEIAMYVLAVACFLFFMVKGVRAKIFEAVLIVAVLSLIRGIVKITKTRMFPALRFSVLFFIFLTMFLANEFELYRIIPFLDKFEHLLSGVILSFVGLLIFRNITKDEAAGRSQSKLAIWFTLYFAVAMAGIWEVYEFTADYLFGLNTQTGSLTDTMTDIICGAVGAAATAIYLFRKAKHKQMPLIDVNQ